MNISSSVSDISPLLAGQGNTWSSAEGAGVREGHAFIFCVFSKGLH